MAALLWNNPQPSAHFRGIVRVGLSNQGGDWPNATPEFYVNGSKVTARQAARYLRDSETPVIDWILNAGIPAGFDSANVMALRAVVEKVYKALGGLWGISKAKRAAIFHLSDAENWTGYPAQNFASQLCDWLAWCLKDVGFTGPYGNYATVPAGKPTLYPCAQTAAAGVTQQVLVGYMVSEPGKCYSPADVGRCMARAFGTGTAATPFWVVLSEYNDHESFEDAAALRAKILIWTDEAKRKADPAWAAAQDKLLAGYLGASA